MKNEEGSITSSKKYHEQNQRQESIRNIGFKHKS